MNASRTILLLSFIAVCIVVASCAKREAPATAFSRMVGKWKKTEFATDDNNNGKIEQGEMSPQPAAIDNELFFKSDGTGVETTVANKEPQTPLNFHWQIIKSDSLKIEYKANDTITYDLVSVTGADLTIMANSPQGLLWYYYRKL